ncbi:MAG: TylF/MycF/NovP-related O-methyltransferase, partial [Acetobacteraceae bacterium]
MLDWPYRADPPQRYSGNYARYRAGGGLVHPHADAHGFLAAEPGNRGDMGRFYFFSLVLDQLAKEGLEGDLAELGVYRGSTAVLIATIARRLGRTAFLMDTFAGFPAQDLQGIDADKQPGFADTSVEAVRALVGTANTRFIKGYFPDTATELPANGRYCLVHIDCDLYAPIRAALDYFYPRLVPGGFLVVHDYSSLHWNGAERAVDEFFADKVECPVPLTDGAGSVVIRKARDAKRAAEGALTRRRALIGQDWTSAAGPHLSELLVSGWSAPESWGVWGVGAAHELLLYPDLPLAGDIGLDADVHVPLVGARMAQAVTVHAGGTQVGRWEFGPQENRAVRRVVIPRTLAVAAMGADPKHPSVYP